MKVRAVVEILVQHGALLVLIVKLVTTERHVLIAVVSLENLELKLQAVARLAAPILADRSSGAYRRALTEIGLGKVYAR